VLRCQLHVQEQSPLISGSTMTSTNPAFASKLFDSSYSDEGARNPIFEAAQQQGDSSELPGEGKANPLYSSSILDTGASSQSGDGATSGGGRRRRNPLFDSRGSSASGRGARTASEGESSASRRFRSLFTRRRTETS
jgi:hypothetical protein